MRFARFFLALVVLLLQAVTAHAEDAETLLKEGVELRRVGKEVEALEKFKQAQAITPSARALGQIGLASKSLRLYVDAERALLAALAATSDAWVQQNRSALELARDVVAKQLATVIVRSNVADAELFVNGAKLSLAEPARVLAGVAHVEVRAAKHRAAQADHNLPAGQTTELTIDLEKIEDAHAPSVAPSIEPEPSATPPAPTEPARPSRGRRVATYAAAGVGVLGVGVGTFFGFRMLSAKSDRDAVCNEATCPTDEGVQHDADARSAATISTIGFAVGIAALATAAVLFFTEPRPARAASFR